MLPHSQLCVFTKYLFLTTVVEDGNDSSDDDGSSAMNSDSEEADSPNPEIQRENFDMEIPIQHRVRIPSPSYNC